MKRSPSPRTMRRLIEYCPSKGSFVWLKRPRWMFSSNRSCSVWNARFPGNPALAVRMSNGYLGGTILWAHQYAHRAAWAIYHDAWPPEQIDHIDGNRANNRISNLRIVSNAENSRNRQIYSNNTSGCPGVGLDRYGRRWRARIKVDYREIHLGTFDTMEEAIAARLSAERSFGFHENNGRAAA